MEAAKTELEANHLQNDLLTFGEFILRLKISRRTGRRLIDAGEIGYTKVSASIRVPAAEIEKYLAKRWTPAKTAHTFVPPSIHDTLEEVLPRQRRAAQ